MSRTPGGRTANEVKRLRNYFRPSDELRVRPVCTICGISLGVSEANWWVRSFEEYVDAVEFLPGVHGLWLTPVLDLDLPTLKQFLIDGLCGQGLDPDLSERFPYIEVLVRGLRWPSDSYLEDSLRWAPYFAWEPRIKQALKKICSQRFRPKAARKFARQLLEDPVFKWNR